MQKDKNMKIASEKGFRQSLPAELLAASFKIPHIIGSLL